MSSNSSVVSKTFVMAHSAAKHACGGGRGVDAVGSGPSWVCSAMACLSDTNKRPTAMAAWSASENRLFDADQN